MRSGSVVDVQEEERAADASSSIWRTTHTFLSLGDVSRGRRGGVTLCAASGVGEGERLRGSVVFASRRREERVCREQNERQIGCVEQRPRSCFSAVTFGKQLSISFF
ncbi:hypothetical protein EYF80_058121 [Liparis tanakae]|uniref:Uncharacterized protein n=1 Tax=Liparis tanakae TaxID=230148 RepID=A0A4Z2ET16_9TELE|nr:hypothetical protein EYF80_058121 [Liparis tanakae]